MKGDQQKYCSNCLGIRDIFQQLKTNGTLDQWAVLCPAEASSLVIQWQMGEAIIRLKKNANKPARVSKNIPNQESVTFFKCSGVAAQLSNN